MFQKKNPNSAHFFRPSFLQILMSVLKALTDVIRTATTMLAPTLVVATLAGDWMLMASDAMVRFHLVKLVKLVS